MKRYLCPKHIHYLKTEGKAVQLSTEKCTICKKEARPIKLKDMANELERIAYNMKFAADNPYYDPHGVTYDIPFEKLVVKWIKSIHPDYGKNWLKAIGEIKLEKEER